MAGAVERCFSCKRAFSQPIRWLVFRHYRLTIEMLFWFGKFVVGFFPC
jgi:hypothetical protein